jgi:hypothetical protein
MKIEFTAEDHKFNHKKTYKFASIKELNMYIEWALEDERNGEGKSEEDSIPSDDAYISALKLDGENVNIQHGGMWFGELKEKLPEYIKTFES